MQSFGFFACQFHKMAEKFNAWLKSQETPVQSRDPCMQLHCVLMTDLKIDVFVDPEFSQKYLKKDYQRLILILSVEVDLADKYIEGLSIKRFNFNRQSFQRHEKYLINAYSGERIATIR